MADPYEGLGVSAPTKADPYEGLGVSAPSSRPKTIGAASSVNVPSGAPPQAEPEMSWGEVGSQAWKNAPQSAGNLVHAMAQPILHPKDTINALGTVARGLEAPMQNVKVTLPNGQTVYRPQPVPETAEETTARTAPANAVGKFYGDRYGSMEGFKKGIASDPFGVAADVSVPLTMGGSALARVPGALGKVGEVASAAGRVIDPVNQTLNLGKQLGGYVASATEKVASNALGGMTGATARDVRAAGRAGMEPGGSEAFYGQFSGKADKAIPVDLAQSALAQKVAEKNKEYRSGMHDISQDRTILLPEDWDRIDNAIGSAGEKGKFKGAIVKENATAVNDKIATIINDWKTLNADSPIFKNVPPAELHAGNFHTPEGIDALKRSIGDVYSSTPPNTTERVAAGEAYNAVKKEINLINPKYAEVMGKYGDALHDTNDIRKTLSLGEKASTDTALGKLQSTSRQTAQTRGRVQMVDELSRLEPDLPYALAGQNLNALAPKGLVAKLGAGGGVIGTGGIAAVLHNPAIAAAIIPALLASSPKLVGGAAYGAGRVRGMAGRGANALHLNADTIRELERAGFQGGRINALAGGQ